MGVWVNGSGSDAYVAGTDCCDVWEVDESPSVLVYGHSGAVAAVAWHPGQPSVLVSVDSEGQVSEMLRSPLTVQPVLSGRHLYPSDWPHHPPNQLPLAMPPPHTCCGLVCTWQG
jgi:hypothetical protein